MNSHRNAWEKLVVAARRAPDLNEPAEAPPGFATRMAALALGNRRERSLTGLAERFSWRALGLAGALAVASVAFNLGPVLNAIDRDVLAAQDPVAALIDLS